VTEIEEHEGGS